MNDKGLDGALLRNRLRGPERRLPNGSFCRGAKRRRQQAGFGCGVVPHCSPPLPWAIAARWRKLSFEEPATAGDVDEAAALAVRTGGRTPNVVDVVNVEGAVRAWVVVDLAIARVFGT